MRKTLFGPSRDAIWQQLADQLGAEYSSGGLFKPPLLRARTEHWEIVLDSESTQHTSFTRLRAPFLSREAFRMRIFRQGFVERLGIKLGMEDIHTGFPDFDQAFVVQASRSDGVIRLLQDEQIRRLLLDSSGVTLTIKDDEGFFGARYPKGVDILQARKSGIIRDLEELKRLFALFAVVLDRLVETGLAFARDPGMKL
jgi:hypothetical protein